MAPLRSARPERGQRDVGEVEAVHRHEHRGGAVLPQRRDEGCRERRLPRSRLAGDADQHRPTGTDPGPQREHAVDERADRGVVVAGGWAAPRPRGAGRGDRSRTGAGRLRPGAVGGNVVGEHDVGAGGVVDALGTGVVADALGASGVVVALGRDGCAVQVPALGRLGHRGRHLATPLARALELAVEERPVGVEQVEAAWLGGGVEVVPATRAGRAARRRPGEPTGLAHPRVEGGEPAVGLVGQVTEPLPQPGADRPVQRSQAPGLTAALRAAHRVPVRRAPDQRRARPRRGRAGRRRRR